ncbi:MAG: FAD-dependent oxidoreductase [Balneolaceae bacterium]
MDRKEFLKQGSAASLGLAIAPFGTRGNPADEKSSRQKRAIEKPGTPKRVIVAGGGIAGLCCGYELMMLGHEVVVLDAAGRYGGHVLTGRDGLSDGLYVDFGAEGFTNPCYEKFREYVNEFGLEVLPYHHRINRLIRSGDEYITDEERFSRQHDRAAELGGFNEREKEYLSSNPIWNLESLYLAPYWEKFDSDYQPFGIGLDDLDYISIADVYEQDGASPAARALLGGSQTSALFKIWQSYILHVRGLPIHHPEYLYRLKGGNQTITNEFARRLGPRLQLDCKVTAVEQGSSGVTVTYEEFGETRTMDADALANCLPVPAWRNIEFSPGLPETKQYIMNRVAYSSYPRIAFQARTRFWEEDGLPINYSFGSPELSNLWEIAQEVDTHRSVLMATGAAGITPERALDAFRRLYPGDSSRITIEQTLVKDWTQDTFAPSCERQSFPMGTLSDFWPHIMAHFGNIHFAGAYADNNNWGMEAATNSANRIAQAIDQA